MTDQATQDAPTDDSHKPAVAGQVERSVSRQCAPVVVAYGGGTNSTALLVGMLERGERPDLILFADTGGEKPWTYTHTATVSDWCESVGFPRIETVRYANKAGQLITLYDKCISGKMLPSIAYGFKSCSEKWKRRPQDRYVSQWAPAHAAWAAGLKVVKLIGYDADEDRRAGIAEDAQYTYRYPLILWGWDRDDCVAAIARAGLPQPGKSACFFCPNSTEAEIRALPPELQEKAVAMEDNAELTTIAGLGRRFPWRDVIRSDKAQGRFDFGTPEMPCGCFDG
jgi:hypothetical protein